MSKSKINIHEFLEQNRIAGLREVWHVFVMGFRATPLINIVSLILQFGAKLIAPAQIWISKLIVDTIVALADNADSSSAARQRVITLLALEFGLVALNKLLSIANDILSDRGIYTYDLIMRKRIMHQALSLDMAYFDNSEFIKRYFYLEGSFKDIPARTYGWMTRSATDIWGALVYIPLFLSLDPRVMLLAIVSPLASYFFTMFMGPRYRKRREAEWAIEAKATYYSNLASSYEYAKEVRVFGLREWLFSNFREKMKKLHASLLRGRVLRLSGDLIDFVLNQIAYYIAYAISIFETITGRMSLGSLTMVIQSFEQLRSQMNTMFHALDADMLKDISEFSTFMNLIPCLTDPKRGVAIEPGDFRSLQIDDVSYAYEESEIAAADRISFSLKRGEHIALVGDNGSGKSTLIKLLLRLYEPDSGHINLNNHDISEYKLDDVRGLFSVIFQDFVRYRTTVRENIQISQVGSRRKVEESARLAGADEFISRLPKGYEALLNKRYPGDEEAQELSEGQWQKIALARAFYRNAPILILDEPTASVDARTEYKLYKYFKEHAKDKTLILISHHFSSVRFADRIYVLDKGRIIEQGTHHELMGQKGKYAEMFNMQMEGLTSGGEAES
ncbi:hypothetical protein AUK40_04335 [Candidatus Wirthbacteria bacterium CG2_30_54_11]|uniref:ABC transporter domain-containing protein n=1 Tax=Candidatus Wirthbacteria bacterium CG2_30_54_11 TaxID=1817892 RepID=A0A1J5J077_9BACT|nr:MAG: hypothetical protein AUK40_04335 [Candidatus Wirthbacteria bacterium CG2_30_54_11]